MSHRYRLRLTALVSGLVLLCAAPATAGRELHGRQVGPALNRLAWSSAGTYVLGDSITAEGSAVLQARRPRWTINGVHGRLVSTLPLMIANVRAVDQRPFRVVIELGSNQTARWSKADYAAAIAALPTSTRVLLVTPYKEPGGHWAPKGVLATARYAHWMQQVARERPHTCVVPWRGRAGAHPEWLRDGLHPTDDGYVQWADLILQTDSTCR